MPLLGLAAACGVGAAGVWSAPPHFEHFNAVAGFIVPQ